MLSGIYDGIEYRGFGQSIVEELAQYATVPVWNGLTNEFHPTQILADFLTIKEQFGRLKGINFGSWATPDKYGDSARGRLRKDGHELHRLRAEEIFPRQGAY